MKRCVEFLDYNSFGLMNANETRQLFFQTALYKSVVSFEWHECTFCFPRFLYHDQIMCRRHGVVFTVCQQLEHHQQHATMRMSR